METTNNTAQSASVKIILENIKGIIGLKSITFLLDDSPLQTIPLGGTEVISIKSGPHNIQTVLKSQSFVTFFIPITRKSEVLNFNADPDSTTTIAATYNRTWGNLELQKTA